MRARAVAACRPAASRATSCCGRCPSGARTFRSASETSQSSRLAVGRELHLGPEGLDEVARAAELHDIGKIAVPDAILDKPGPLDPVEWSFMRRHPLIGERILLAAPALRPVARLVRSSHERWDGGGYPDGLRGDEIPLGARVVAVCDAFDAMTTERPYREPMPEAEAIAELRALRGHAVRPVGRRRVLPRARPRAPRAGRDGRLAHAARRA